MTTSRRFAFARLGFALLVIVRAGPLVAQEMSAQEQAVWQREETYWRYVKAGDVENYMTLWHEGFVGWPRTSASPVEKAGIRQVFQQLAAQRRQLSYEFLQKVVHVRGDVGVADYSVKVSYTDKEGKAQTDLQRLTHTWVKSGDRWLILGGMSCTETNGHC